MSKDSEDFNRILDEMCTLRAAKNADYGNSFYQTYDEFGLVGVAMDLGRKYGRIKIFANTKTLAVKDETIEDTLKDLAILAVNCILWLRSRKKGGETCGSE